MNHAPELIGALCLIVIGHRQFGAEEEILDRILMQDAVDQDALRMALKVDAMVATAVAVQCAPVALDLLEFLPAQGIEVIRQYLKVGKQVELEILG